MADLRYPIGPFSPDANPTPESRTRHIDEIAALPAKFRQAVGGLSKEQVEDVLGVPVVRMFGNDYAGVQRSMTSGKMTRLK